ncbi:Rib/alpha-like domain-containing protein [Ligilactobacillus murinus]|uniref:Rib/alpha-like domain-containing protein n=1 Tax=Ligilactobacillus murinus TaxID=1622 RepID=UPI003865967E
MTGHSAYPLNAVFLQEPKDLIANTAELPADATYALIKKPDLSTNGTKNAVVKVSFLDQYDKNYNHEIEVQVPVKVEGVNLKDGEFTLKPLVMHVNEVNDDLRPLPVEELESWHETDGTKTLNGQALRSLVKSVTWSQSPSTKKAGQARGVVTVTTKDDKTMLANVPVNIVGATARVDLKTPWGIELLAKDAVADTTALAQFDKADSPVTYKWKEPLNVTPTATADHVMHNAVVVTYGDKTTQEVPVSVTVGPSQASKFTVAPAKVEVHYGQKVDPEASLTPEQKTHFNVSQVTLEQPVVTTKLGQVNANGQVVFNDGSTASVEVPVVVVGATAKNDVTTAWNILPTPQTLVSNVASLAKYTPTYTWNKRPDVSSTKEESHVVSGVVDVTYPDKVVQHLPVTLTVLASQAERFDNATDKQVLPVVVAYGATELDAMHALEPETKTDFDVTQATFTTPVDTATVGTKEVPATLTFADTSTTTLPVQVEVLGADVASKVETAWGKLPTAKDMVTNADELEQFGASYSWKNAPVVTPSAGEDHQVTGTLLVTYHNGSTQTLPVSLTVKASEGERFANDQDVHLNEVSVNYGAKVPADKAVNALTTEEKTKSKVTVLVFKQDVDTLTAGEKLYPVQLSFNDGSKLDSQVLVKVVGAVAKQELTTPWGRNVAAKDLVANTSGLDRFGTQEHPVTYQWVTDPDVTPEPEQTHTVTGTVTVTYGDGATQQLPVSFTVEPSDAEKATNELKNSNVAFTVNYGAKVDPTQALTVYSTETKNKTKLTIAKFAGAVETTELGMNAHPVTLTFADGSTLAVELPVKVVGAQVDPTLKTAWGKVPDPSTVVNDLTELAKFDPKYTWKVQPVTTPLPDRDHHVQGTLQVEFADGATQTVPVELDVAPSMAEAAKDLQMQLVVEDLKASVPATDALKGLTEQDRQVYSVTQALFDHPVETNEVGVKSYEATLTFADGSTAKLPVQVKVVSQAENLAPVAKEGLNVSLGETLAPTDVLTPAVVLPKETQLSWKTPVDTTKAGHQTGELEVTYPDGSKDVVKVPVKVGTDAEAMTPTVRPAVEVALNGNLNPTDVLSSDLPKETQLSWKTPVDTTKAGHQTGELEVTYPDGSKDVAEVPVKVGTDAEAMTPTVRPDFGVALNGELNPTDVLNSDLSKDTQLSWKTPVDTTKAGRQTGELEVTYPDGSKEVVEVPVKVGTDAEALTPTVRPDLEVALNGQLTLEQVLSSDLPKETRLSWKTPVDTTKAGHQTGELEVTYPDGSKDVVEVPVKVGTDAEALTPTVRPTVEVALNGELNPNDVLSSDLPKETQLSWKTPVDTTKVGHQTGELEVTYPDGSKDVVEVPVKVGTDAEALTPTVRPAVEVALNGKLNPTDVLSSDLPKETQLSWKMPVDTSKAGHQTGELEVTYPDGSKDVVKVPVKVGTDAEAMTPTVRPDFGVALNGELNPTDVLNSDLPKDTQLSWKTPVDTTKADRQTGELEVTYPDGSKEVVEVPVKVGTDAEALTPIVRPDLEVALNGQLTLEQVLGSDLPKETQLSWKTTVDTTKAGHQTGELEVTYPDGSKDVVEVPVKVGTDAEALTPTVRPTVEVALNGELNLTDVLSSDLPKETRLSWKTSVDTTKAGHQTGELEVTYPDGSKEVVEVPVKVGTDAEALTPTVRSDLEVALNGELAPTDVLNSELPKDTQLSWKTPVDTTKAGHQTGELEVTYSDGSKDMVKVTVEVVEPPKETPVTKPVSESVDPQAKENLQVGLGKTLEPTKVLDGKTLPTGTRLSWKTPVDTTKVGHQTGELEVTYPDGSKDVVKVTVEVVEPPKETPVTKPVSESVDPQAKENLQVGLGETLEPTKVLDGKTLPTGTRLSWKTPVDTTKAGHQTGELEVTYPDGSKDVVKVTVEVVEPPKETPVTKPVSESVDPQVKEKMQVGLGEMLDPAKVLADKGSLPTGTQVSWKTPVDTTKAGYQAGELEVTYPDGSKDLVKVLVKVGTDADMYTPVGKLGVMVSLNAKVAPQQFLDTNRFPKDTQFTFEKDFDTTNSGEQKNMLKVVYPDGSYDEVVVSVKVYSEADLFTPKMRAALKVTKGTSLALDDLFDEGLPTDAQVKWLVLVDTNKVGTQTGKLEVSYRDGSKDMLNVVVDVVEADQAQRLTDVFHVNGPKEGSAVNNWKKVTGKQHTAGAKKHKEVLPQTGEHEHESPTLLGMMLLMLLGTFKFGYKKKH